MKMISAAGGVLYRRVADHYEVAIIYRNGVWDLPKGTQKKGESARYCAHREVAEELGIASPEIECFLASSYHEYEREGQAWGKTTRWFRMKSKEQKNFSPQKEEGITHVAWVELQKVRSLLGYENLQKVITQFEESVQP